jgi:hypothetical protein
MKAPAMFRAERRALNLEEFKQRAPREEDVGRLITESTLIFDDATGELLIVYLVLDEPCADVEAALDTVHFDETSRTSGMRTRSRVFGHQPRVMPRRDFCTAASLSRENPDAHAVIAKYANRVSAYYQQYNPERYQRHAATTEKVLDEWRLEGTPFTSGIINRNNPLAYHFDAGNFKDVWSNMLVFKRGVTGGYLATPELDVMFALPNNSLLMFDGQQLLHGVTPIGLADDQSVRYSIVFYSLKQMWNCLPFGEEVQRFQGRRFEREKRRLARQRGGASADGEGSDDGDGASDGGT